MSTMNEVETILSHEPGALAPESIEAELNRARAASLRAVYLGGAGLGSVAYLLAVARAVVGDGSFDRLVVLAPFVLIGWILALTERIPHSVRSILLALIVFGLGVEDLLNVGLSGQFRPNLMVAVVLLAGLLGVRVGLIAFGVSAVAAGLFGWSIANNLLLLPITMPDPLMSAAGWPILTIRYVSAVVALVIIVHYLVESLRLTLVRQRRLIALLQRERQAAAARVAARTRTLQVAAELSSNIAAVPEQGQLIMTLVERIRAEFDYYHLQVFLFDAERKNLIVAGGTGEAGQALFVGGHRLPLGKGLVGRAAAANEIILVPDTSQESDWQPNPLLPDSKSALAVPIVVNDEVIGVLDVHQDSSDGLAQADVQLLRAVANQVGIALQNAELFREMERAATHQSSVNEIRRKILLAPDIDQLVQISARELAVASKVAACRIQLTPAAQVTGSEL